ncbi:hypothetical protein DFQ28_006479 [Apophysomyces sp. BC1034]|nr:hypothetical protein DFQ29_003925 [Apophysomyces sp. BC1021]KAG0193104.1 hypothetical protein DFQ28_006479 [Apophysomyces sp. BC1034]
MVLDPAMLIATFPNARPCHFWALARFFRVPVLGRVFRSAGVLPVDTKTHSNAKLFEHTLDCLERGGVIALFPEGTSYTAPCHLPFKDGISWATYEYLSQQASKSKDPVKISIVPVGITASSSGPRLSEDWEIANVVGIVTSRYGEPIIVSSEDLHQFQQVSKETVKELTTRIAHGVEQGTINSPDWDTANAASEAKFLLFGDARGVRLEDHTRVSQSQSFIDIFHPDEMLKDDEHKEDRAELKQQLLTFSKMLKRLRLTALDISMYENQEITWWRALLRLISTWMALAVQLPLFLPGMIVNFPIYVLGRLVNRFEKYAESVAQDKLVVSIGFAIPLYSIVLYLLWRALGSTLLGFVIALALIPMFAWYHMALVDKRYDTLKQVIASWRIFNAVVTGETYGIHQRREIEDCVQLRRWCHSRTKTLLINLAQSGNPKAQYLVEYGRPLFQCDTSS